MPNLGLGMKSTTKRERRMVKQHESLLLLERRRVSLKKLEKFGIEDGVGEVVDGACFVMEVGHERRPLLPIPSTTSSPAETTTPNPGEDSRDATQAALVVQWTCNKQLAPLSRSVPRTHVPHHTLPRWPTSSRAESLIRTTVTNHGQGPNFGPMPLSCDLIGFLTSFHQPLFAALLLPRKEKAASPVSTSLISITVLKLTRMLAAREARVAPTARVTVPPNSPASSPGTAHQDAHSRTTGEISAARTASEDDRAESAREDKDKDKGKKRRKAKAWVKKAAGWLAGKISRKHNEA
ncbi:hypothetical protein BKA81DRAFT_381197 [Phyllosticta paracitricarpa]|uniref:Uncharacterized protein n=1 Tax=Phyllosticta citricarpa TaxID=55181 RepID=A0ABR1LLP3_9PEZI